MRIFTLILGLLIYNLSFANNYDGINYFKKDSIEFAILSFTETLSNSDNDDSLVVAHHYLGYLYSVVGEVDKSLSSSIKAIKIYEDKNQTKKAIGVYNNIALMYRGLGDYANCEKYYKIALDMAYEHKADEEICTIQSNIGALYITIDKYDVAISHLNKSLSYKSKNYRIQVTSLSNLGIAMYKKGNLDKCKFYLELSDRLIKKRNIDDKDISFIIKLYRYKLTKDTTILRELDTLKSKVRLVNQISLVREQIKVFENRDSLFEVYDSLVEKSHANNRDELMAKYEKRFDLHRKNSEISKLNTENELQTAKLKNNLYLSVGLGLIAFIGVVFLIIVAFKNKTIKLKNAQVKEKNKEITDSINYAKHVQVALNKNNNLFEQMFGKDKGCVIYKPKDILSGDFYWMHENEYTKYFGVIDCTGHGIYGGMLTMLVGSGLDNIVSHNNSVDLNNLIMKLDEHIRKSLDNVKLEDVMDFVICKIDKSTNKMTTINKGNKLTLISSGELTEYKCLSETTIDYKSGDKLYLLSDGLRDQFGGDDGKKYKLSRQRELLLDISTMSASEQANVIEEEIIKWMGTYEQNDDITIMCIDL